MSFPPVPAFPFRNAHEKVMETKEDIIDVPEIVKNRDKYFRARVKRNVDGEWFSGTVLDIERGATSKEKLCKLRYDDGDWQHLIYSEVKEASEAYDGSIYGHL